MPELGVAARVRAPGWSPRAIKGYPSDPEKILSPGGNDEQKLWALTAAGPFVQAHLEGLTAFPPGQEADTLSMKKAVDDAMRKLNKRGD